MRQQRIASRPRISSASTSWLLVSALCAAGCGANEYERRLENTQKYFAHQEQLNAHLHNDWSSPDGQIQVRVPKQFLEIQGPEPQASADGEGDPGKVVIDERQPKFLNIELPGLRAAFYAPLSIIAANNTSAQANGFLYVLTNHYLADKGEKAQLFHNDAMREIAEALHVAVRPEDWRDEKYPSRPGTFLPPVFYKAASFTPSEPIAGVENLVTVDLFQQGDIQVAFVWFLPKDIDGSEKMPDRMTLCLETLKVAGDKLSHPSSGTSGSSTGSGNTGAF